MRRERVARPNCRTSIRQHQPKRRVLQRCLARARTALDQNRQRPGQQTRDARQVADQPVGLFTDQTTRVEVAVDTVDQLGITQQGQRVLLLSVAHRRRDDLGRLPLDSRTDPLALQGFEFSKHVPQVLLDGRLVDQQFGSHFANKRAPLSRCIKVQRIDMDQVMRAGGNGILEVGRKLLAAQLAAQLLLHSWGQVLNDHVHVHCMVPACGIHLDTGMLVRFPKRGQFLSLKVLAATFRDLLIGALEEAHASGKLQLTGRWQSIASPAAFKAWLDPVRRINWQVRHRAVWNPRDMAKRDERAQRDADNKAISNSNNGPVNSVIGYLAQYANRVVIAASRPTWVGRRQGGFSVQGLPRQESLEEKSVTRCDVPGALSSPHVAQGLSQQTPLRVLGLQCAHEEPGIAPRTVGCRPVAGRSGEGERRRRR